MARWENPGRTLDSRTPSELRDHLPRSPEGETRPSAHQSWMTWFVEAQWSATVSGSNHENRRLAVLTIGQVSGDGRSDRLEGV